MLACISPAYSSANHTINTLRYSDRLKEKGKNSNVIITGNVNNVNNSNNINNINKSNEFKINKKEEIIKEKTDRNIRSARLEKFKGRDEMKIKEKKDFYPKDNSYIIDESEVN
jgi:hypothetical protein